MELAWPISPLPLLLSQAVWLAMIALPAAPQRRDEPSMA